MIVTHVIRTEVRAYVCDSRTMDNPNLLDWIAIIHLQRNFQTYNEHYIQFKCF